MENIAIWDILSNSFQELDGHSVRMSGLELH